MARELLQKFYQEVAEHPLWEEVAREEAIDDYGLTAEEDIASHIQAAQTDLDYLIGQDEQLETFIARARSVIDEMSGEGLSAGEPIHAIAGYELWDERCRRKAESEYGLTDEAEIQKFINAEQADLDYNTGQDETLEGVVASVRAHIGFAPEIYSPNGLQP